MRFVFARRFYILLALGLIPLSLSWNFPALRSAVLIFDVLLVIAASIDYFISGRLLADFTVERRFNRRFRLGDQAQIYLKSKIRVRASCESNSRRVSAGMILGETREVEFTSPANTSADFFLSSPRRRGAAVIDSAQRRCDFLSKLGLVWCQTELGEAQSVKVYPNMRRAREMELKALGARSYLAIQRKQLRRGEGREFESMRDYVPGDELRHVSWTATARRNKLTSRQYQIERDQTIVIALDAGRLMTGRIGDETKFDTAIHAALALMSAAARGGDNCGLVVFGRKVKNICRRKKASNIWTRCSKRCTIWNRS
jgi:uncharacterized protein (DUF58 family)